MSETPGESEKPNIQYHLVRWEQEQGIAGIGNVEDFDFPILAGPRQSEFIGAEVLTPLKNEMARARAATKGLMAHLVELQGTGTKTAYHEITKSDGWLRLAIMQADLTYFHSEMSPSARIIVVTEFDTGIYTPQGNYEEERTTDAVIDYQHFVASVTHGSWRQDLTAETSGAWRADAPRHVEYDPNTGQFRVWGAQNRPRPLPNPPETYHGEAVQAAQYGEYTETVAALFGYLGEMSGDTLKNP